jgi:beta-galactosidase
MHFNFWRALTDNDRGWKVQTKMAAWRDAGTQTTAEECIATRGADGAVTIEGRVRIPAPDVQASVRHVVGAGTIDTHVRLELPAGGPEPVRLGLQCEIPADLATIGWYGRGPHESYRDRWTSAAIGVYETTLDKWITPYVRPQENANRTDVRWIRFTAGDGRGLRISAPAAAPLSVSAWPYTQDDLAAARHDGELPRRERITLNVDHVQMGVGGDNSWGAEVHREYRIATGRTYEWMFRMQPLPPQH